MFAERSPLAQALRLSWLPKVTKPSRRTQLGHGSWLDETLHYHLEVGGKFVEVGCRSNGNDLLVSGSSTRNAKGNYIAWTERLRRVSSLVS